MRVSKLVRSSRSVRRFFEREGVPFKRLSGWMETLCFLPSARNLQPLRYVSVADQAMRERLFPLLGWAGYLKGKGTPPEGERPSLYVVVGYDRRLGETAPLVDMGIAAQTLLLLAREDGYGGCIIASFDAGRVSGLLGVEEWFGVGLVVALGRPKEEVVVVPVKEGIEYYRDDKDVHYVPKRALSDIWIRTV